MEGKRTESGEEGEKTVPGFIFVPPSVLVVFVPCHRRNVLTMAQTWSGHHVESARK